MKVSLNGYIALSFVGAGAAIASAYYKHGQYFPAVVHLMNSKSNMLIMANLLFCIMLLCAAFMKTVFIGSLTEFETESVIDNLKYSLTETALALTIFREELNFRVVFLFLSLLCVKAFHWLCSMRVDRVARSPNLSPWIHIRLSLFLLSLFTIDAIVVHLIGSALSGGSMGVLLLFGFEYLILAVDVLSVVCKYILLSIDTAQHNRWERKSMYMFYADLMHDLIRLILYVVFFVAICSIYGLPIHLIRELYFTFSQLRARVVKFCRYRRIVRDMNERFPTVAEEDLESMDRTCIICREDMHVPDRPKRLPCQHVFHFDCLRTWMERSQSCPTCRQAIPIDAPAVPHAPPVPNHPAPAHVPPPVVAHGPPPPVHPHQHPAHPQVPPPPMDAPPHPAHPHFGPPPAGLHPMGPPPPELHPFGPPHHFHGPPPPSFGPPPPFPVHPHVHMPPPPPPFPHMHSPPSSLVAPPPVPPLFPSFPTSSDTPPTPHTLASLRFYNVMLGQYRDCIDSYSAYLKSVWREQMNLEMKWQTDLSSNGHGQQETKQEEEEQEEPPVDVDDTQQQHVQEEEPEEKREDGSLSAAELRKRRLQSLHRSTPPEATEEQE